MFHGNRTEVPSRQPFNAPSGLVTQKNEGFEHFLKTHSSPNHQRVTAGGRIIPMEMRPVPPRFSLSALKETPDTGSDQKMDQVSQIINTSKNHFADPNSGMNSPSKVGASRYDNASSNALISLTVSPDLPSHESIPLNLQQAALESNILMQNQLLAYGQGLSSGSLYPTVPGISGQVTHLGQQYPMNIPYLPYAVSSTSNDLSNSDLPLAWNADPYVLSTLRAMLTQANQSFEIYDQQLKDLDKYRATHNRQDELVRQRVTIVARRAEIKDEIRRLQATISVRENEHMMARSMPPTFSSADTQSPLLKQHRANGRPLTIQLPHQVSDTTSKAKPTATSKLNVSAAAYVPVKKANTIASSTSASKIGSSAELRMLELPASHYSRIDSGSPELKATDSWGERVGAPPVHLLREQKSLAEAILSLSNSPKVSDDDTSNSTSAQSCTFTSEPTNKTASPNPGAGFDRTRRAPAPIEADYERQIDAMRKPEGTVSHIFLSDGRSQVVHGVNLKQPHPHNMTDFEHAYWARKPPYHDYSSFGKENSRAPSFTAKTSTLSFENSVHSQDQAKPYSGSLRNSPSRQVLLELSTSIGHNPNSSASPYQQNEWDAAMQKLNTEVTRRTSLSNNAPENSTGPGIIGDLRPTLDQEALANKTYSSTSVQNINVISSLPRSLDGIVEANLRKINSPGKGSNKTKSPKSPRTIFRSAGDVWFGPFRRTFHDTKSKDDEEDLAHLDRAR